MLPNTIHFKSTQDRLSRLIADGYYDESVFAQYDAEFLDRFYRNVEDCGFEFDTFLGAFKFHRSYALKTSMANNTWRTSRNAWPPSRSRLPPATRQPPNRISKNSYQAFPTGDSHFPQPR